MMNDEEGEKERIQRFPCMPSTNFASLAYINIPLLHKNSTYNSELVLTWVAKQIGYMAYIIGNIYIREIKEVPSYIVSTYIEYSRPSI